MSEVDRLSNSGLYPALPLADKRRRREGQDDRTPQGDAADKSPAEGAAPAADKSAQTGIHRIPKSLIDEYA